jgi:hypothetical protein
MESASYIFLLFIIVGAYSDRVFQRYDICSILSRCDAIRHQTLGKISGVLFGYFTHRVT